MTRDELKAYLEANYADCLTYLDTGRYDPFFEAKASEIVKTCQRLKDDEKLQFDFLCNLNGTDTGEKFEVVYNIASIPQKLRVDLKVSLPYDQAVIDSVQAVWPAANWYEREMWELYGIDVNNHDNLTRFLLQDDWDQGHPMRKDWDAPDFIRFPWK